MRGVVSQLNMLRLHIARAEINLLFAVLLEIERRIYTHVTEAACLEFVFIKFACSTKKAPVRRTVKHLVDYFALHDTMCGHLLALKP